MNHYVPHNNVATLIMWVQCADTQKFMGHYYNAMDSQCMHFNGLLVTLYIFKINVICGQKMTLTEEILHF